MKAKGFTLVELIIALAFFSFMMAILSIGVLQIMRIYQANVSSRRTQQVARTVMEDITREVRSASRVADASVDRLCLEGNRPVEYRRISDRMEKRVGGADCNDLGGATTTVLVSTTGEGDANSNLKLRSFSTSRVVDDDGDDTSVKINLLISTGADDLLNGNACRPGVSGSQFCSTTDYTNVVSLRGSNG